MQQIEVGMAAFQATRVVAAEGNISAFSGN
jgi:hypothetical protein